MSIEPVKIPQNVYVEDRIIGPITLRQIILLLIGGGISYAVWNTFRQLGLTDVVSMLIAWSPLAILAAFGFVKINGISLLRFCVLMIEKSEKPGVRTWMPRQGISINIKLMPTAAPKQATPTPRSIENERIDELSAVLDRGPDENVSEHKTERASEDVETPNDNDVLPHDEAAIPKHARLQAAMETKAPVQPDRIAVDAPLDTRRSVDDIRTTALPASASEPTSDAQPLLRDIHPPQTA